MSEAAKYLKSMKQTQIEGLSNLDTVKHNIEELNQQIEYVDMLLFKLKGKTTLPLENHVEFWRTPSCPAVAIFSIF